jgi:hypothetical protein
VPVFGRGTRPISEERVCLIRSDHLDLASVPIFAAAPEQRPAHAKVYDGDEPTAAEGPSAGLRLPL